MIPEAERPPRVDAARNAGKILRAAREAFVEIGPDAPLDEIARRAGVGIRTLYRHFPRKEDLVRAALEQGVAEWLAPAVDRAMGDENPRDGLFDLMDATLALVARERDTLAAAQNAGAVTADVTAPVLDALVELTRRAQGAGLVRADLTADDVHRLMGMLASALWGMDVEGRGWRRYLVLMQDALSPEGASELPVGEVVRGEAARGRCGP